jgi:hypothetical protein
MTSIAQKLAEAKRAAVASSGLETGMKTAAPASSVAKSTQVEPATPTKPGYPLASKRAISVLRKEDLIPKRTKESDVLFQCVKPTLNVVITGVGKPTKRVHFLNQYLLTSDTEVIAYLRKNAKHFNISEVATQVVPPNPTDPAPKKPE